MSAAVSATRVKHCSVRSEDIEAERYSVYSKIQTKILKAELGNDAGIIGAAILGVAD